MSARLVYLFRWEGTVDRGPYVLIGLIGFTLKHNLDRLLATVIFHRPWSLFNYWIPPTRALRITELPREDALFLLVMLALALPFIWVGVALTLRRLRAVHLPAALAVLFFVPVVNILFFILLSVLPSRPEGAGAEPPRRPGALARLIPESAVGSTALALLLTAPLGVAATWLCTSALKDYGWGLFVALPFCQGLAAVLLHSYHRPRHYASCLLVCWLSILFTALVLFGVAIEGLVCIVMAAPIGVVLAAMGGSLGYLIQRRRWSAAEAPAMLLALLVSLPGVIAAERMAAPEPPLFAVETTIEAEAAPDEVWRHVVAFTELPPPDDWIFRIGIAYPLRAEIRGQGAGAVRHCVFSTGTFVEPIEVWDAPRVLRFSVTSNPAPMQEWTPYGAVAPPHLRSFLVSRGGQFRLVPLPGGRTRVEATTWYHHSMWPAAYWRLWSDAIIHRIHTRVLRHVKLLAEAERGV